MKNIMVTAIIVVATLLIGCFNNVQRPDLETLIVIELANGRSSTNPLTVVTLSGYGLGKLSGRGVGATKQFGVPFSQVSLERDKNGNTTGYYMVEIRLIDDVTGDVSNVIPLTRLTGTKVYGFTVTNSWFEHRR